MKISSFLKNTQTESKEMPSDISVKNESKQQSAVKALGLQDTKENREILKALEKNNIEPTKENIQAIKRAFQSMDIPLEDKIKTLKVALKKEIDLTTKNLQSMLRAFSAEVSWDKVFDTISKFFTESEINYEKMLKFFGFSEKMSRTFVENMPKVQSLEENIQLLETTAALDMSEEEILSNFKKKVVAATEKQGEEALMETFEEYGERLKDSVDEVVDAVEGQLEIVAGISFEKTFRVFMVEKVTVEMKEVKEEFMSFQQQVTKTLEPLIYKAPERQEMEKSITDMIYEFESIMTKSKMTLFTSMAQERKLVGLLSTLEEAKRMMDTDVSKTKELLQEIKTSLEKMEFMPKESKIKAYARTEAYKALMNEHEVLAINLKDQIRMPSKTSRNQLELLRTMGLNHDTEVIQTLEKNTVTEINNLKNTLMEFFKGEKFSSESSIANDTLQNISGQQLLSKLEVQSMTQELYFNIPYQSVNKIKNLNVYINSKKESEKIDWKNSTLYFVFELNHYGKTGIKISSYNKKVDMTIKNDTPQLEKVTRKIFEKFLEGLEEIGYRNGRVQFVPMTMNPKEPVQEKKEVYNESGRFDIKI